MIPCSPLWASIKSPTFIIYSQVLNLCGWGNDHDRDTILQWNRSYSTSRCRQWGHSGPGSSWRGRYLLGGPSLSSSRFCHTPKAWPSLQFSCDFAPASKDLEVVSHVLNIHARITIAIVIVPWRFSLPKDMDFLLVAPCIQLNFSNNACIYDFIFKIIRPNY